MECWESWLWEYSMNWLKIRNEENRLIAWSNYTSEWVSESCSVVSNSLWPRGLYSPWNSLGQNTGLGGLSLLQEIFPTQGSNPDLPHCRQMLYQLSHKGSPRVLEWVAFLFSSGSSQPRDLTGVSLIAGGFFTNWAIREAPDYTDWCVNHSSRMYCKQKTSSAIYRIRLSVYKGSLPHHRRI